MEFLLEETPVEEETEGSYIEVISSTNGSVKEYSKLSLTYGIASTSSIFFFKTGMMSCGMAATALALTFLHFFWMTGIWTTVSVFG